MRNNINARLKKLHRTMVDRMEPLVHLMTPEQRQRFEDYKNSRSHLSFGERLSQLEKLIEEHRNSNAGESGKGK